MDKRKYLQSAYKSRTGKDILICVRCFKRIHKNFKYDSYSKLVYGVDCYNKILDRQHLLLIGKELIKVNCVSCGRELKANKIFLEVCGKNIRCCFCCECNTWKYRDFECRLEKFLKSVD